MRRAVAEYRVVGVKTTLPLFERVLSHPAFAAGDYDTSFLDSALLAGKARPGRVVEIAVAVAAIRAYEERRAARRSPGNGGATTSAWGAAGRREAHGNRAGSQG